MAVVKQNDTEKKDRAAQRAEKLAMAGLVRYVGQMLLIAGFAGLLLGSYMYDKDAKARRAMGRAVATVTKEYVHGGMYYITYEADGVVHEAMLPYKDHLDRGDRVDILYDPGWYGNVQTPEPASEPLLILGISAIGVALGGVAMYRQAYLKSQCDTPWDDPA